MNQPAKSAVLFVFSGTGTTGLVADALRDRLTERGVAVDVVRIEDVLKGKRSVDALPYDLVGVGCPVIGFTVPSLVMRFARSLPRGQGRKAFVFRTAGGVAPINFNASRPLVRALRRKGYYPFHERIFSISSNWIHRFDDDAIARLYGATMRKAALMADALIRGEPRELKTGLGQRVLMGIVGSFSTLFFRTVGKDIRVGPECTRCGLCARNCPAGNIVETKSGIRFRLSCASCLRCVYSCPTGALRLRRFASFAVPGGYDIRKILDSVTSGARAGASASASRGAPTSAHRRPEPRFLERYVTDDTL